MIFKLNILLMQLLSQDNYIRINKKNFTNLRRKIQTNNFFKQYLKKTKISFVEYIKKKNLHSPCLKFRNLNFQKFLSFFSYLFFHKLIAKNKKINPKHLIKENTK